MAFVKNKPFVVFEGIDGSGKTSLARQLYNRLNEFGVPSIMLSEPTESQVGKQIREILAGEKKVDPKTMALLFAADRMEHVVGPNGICHHLTSGLAVIEDRYYLSSYAYQMKDMPLEWVMQINSQAKDIVKPDVHIFIDASPEVCLDRIYKTRKTTSDIFENIETLTQTRENFLKVIEAVKDEENVIVVDGNGPIPLVFKRVFDQIKPLFF